LGLTASPSSDKETVKEICENLYIDRVEARAEEDGDVAPYIQETEIQWIKVDLPVEFKKIRAIIEDLLRSDLRQLKDLGFLESADVNKANKRALLETAALIRKDISAGGESYLAASLAASAMKVSHALELLETQGIAALDSYLERLRAQKSKAIRRLFSDERMNALVKTVHDLRILGFDHPKLEEVVKVVKKHEKDRVIVFTQYRDSVNKIIERLNEADILAHEFIGQASKGDSKGMSQKEQIRVLNDFKEGKYNVIVATSVAEEGLDIPAVDLVVFYEPIPSEIRSIQRRGRTGRSESGKVMVLMARQTRDEAYYWAAFHKERKMKGVVKDMKKGFEAPDKGAGQQSLANFGAKPEDIGKDGRIRIFVDTREKSREILRMLRDKADIDIKQLEVGDFILSDRVIAERKTVEDFLASVIDKRLFAQAAEMVRNFSRPVLIIEGRTDIYSIREINPNAVRGAIASLALDFGISIIYSRDEEDTASFLYMIAKREQEDEKREIALRGEKKPVLLEEKQRYVIESLPNVSAVLAKRLLARFGSVSGVMNASKSELMGVEGIGEGKAEEIIKIIRSKYHNDV